MRGAQEDLQESTKKKFNQAGFDLRAHPFKRQEFDKGNERKNWHEKNFKIEFPIFPRLF